MDGKEGERREREREREAETERETETEKQRKRETERQREKGGGGITEYLVSVKKVKINTSLGILECSFQMLIGNFINI